MANPGGIMRRHDENSRKYDDTYRPNESSMINTALQTQQEKWRGQMTWTLKIMKKMEPTPFDYYFETFLQMKKKLIVLGPTRSPPPTSSVEKGAGIQSSICGETMEFWLNRRGGGSIKTWGLKKPERVYASSPGLEVCPHFPRLGDEPPTP